MSDNDFPSGPWAGFYCYTSQDKHRMDLQLDFADGRMRGTGNDDIGAFVIDGRYDAPAKECIFKKTYVGAHTVSYTGYREGKGIWGTWKIRRLFHGGFQIWPLGLGESEDEAISATIEKPLEVGPAQTQPAPVVTDKLT